MDRLTDNLDAIASHIRKDFTTRDKTREKVLPLCREVIRHSSTAIRAVHRQEFKPANKLLISARKLLREAEQAVASYGQLRYTGFFHDAQKEFAEASITLALITEQKTPTPDELKQLLAEVQQTLAEITAQPAALEQVSDDAELYATAAEKSLNKAAEKVAATDEMKPEDAESIQKSLDKAAGTLNGILD